MCRCSKFEHILAPGVNALVFACAVSAFGFQPRNRLKVAQRTVSRLAVVSAEKRNGTDGSVRADKNEDLFDTGCVFPVKACRFKLALLLMG